MGEPFRQRNLLLIAAGEAAQPQLDLGRANVEVLDLILGDLPLAIGLQSHFDRRSRIAIETFL